MGKVLPSVFWVIVGVLLGATVAVLWVKGLNPDWVEATGTWVGGLATVLTLLWAVRVFRDDQAHREGEQQRRHMEALSAEKRLEEQEAAEAAEVKFQLLGGRASGTNPLMNLETIHVPVTNTSDRAATVLDVRLDEPLRFRGNPSLPLDVSAHDTARISHPVQPISVPKGQKMGKPLTTHGALIIYMIKGKTWARRVDEAPYRHDDAA